MKTAYPIPPIVGVTVYREDVVTIRRGHAGDVSRGDRKDITEFSSRARQRLRFVAMNTSTVFLTMVTLTYPAEFPSDGIAVKRHFHAFLAWLARDLKCRPRYLWFLEFQRRGAPHYHILLDYKLPGRLEERKAFRYRLACAWYRIVQSGDAKHLSAGTRVETIRKPNGARRYAVKYATKMRQKRIPADYQNVGRLWGCSRQVVPEAVVSLRATEDDIRGVLEGWRYAPHADRPVYKVLYGVADRFLDNPSKPE